MPDEVIELAGPFELTDAEGHHRCAMALEAKSQGAGFVLTFDRPACVRALPFLSSVAAWSQGPASSIRLIDVSGRVVAEFGETEDGLYEMVRSGEGVFFLSHAGGNEPVDLNPGDVFGTWAFARQPDKPICKVTLTEEPANEDTYQLALADGCDQGITTFGPVSWRIEKTDIVMVSAKGDQLRFERTEDKAWRKVPEAGKPLLLTR
ncbi:MAG: AprI/Inh family metalloprotease inhibitor [Blastochloris sp.]|nr:AprI/Inh family metalloprotease inhibitor [Blastochloris sp.]